MSRWFLRYELSDSAVIRKPRGAFAPLSIDGLYAQRPIITDMSDSAPISIAWGYRPALSAEEGQIDLDLDDVR